MEARPEDRPPSEPNASCHPRGEAERPPAPALPPRAPWLRGGEAARFSRRCSMPGAKPTSSWSTGATAVVVAGFAAFPEVRGYPSVPKTPP